MTPLITILVLAIVIVLLFLVHRLNMKRGRVGLRRLPAFDGLWQQQGQAIESGRPLHISLGRASIVTQNSPTSFAALDILDHSAAEGCANGTPPLVTLGEGTLLPTAQDSLRQAYQKSGRSGEFDPEQAQFIAAADMPFAYAGGTANLLQQEKVTSNIVVGRFGVEIALIAEAANHQDIPQIIGADDPTAVSLAYAFSQNLLIGEELLAASVYLDEKTTRMASLQLQDSLRWFIAFIILILAILYFVL
jgi:hypothetical protein